MNEIIYSYDLLHALKAKVKAAFPGFLVYIKKYRVHALLIASKSSYTLKLYPGDNSSGTDHPLDIRLGRNDVAAITHMGLNLRKQDTSLTPSRYFAPYTFNDPNYFAGIPASGTAATESAALENVYNGTTNIKVQNVDIIKSVANDMFKWVPEKSLQNIASPQTAADPAQWGGKDMEYQGLRFLGDIEYLSGQQNNEIIVNLSEGDYTNIAGLINAAGSAATPRNLLAVTLFGFEVADAATSAPNFR